MELTYEEAQNMMAERFRTYPEMGAIVSAPSFTQELAQIAEFERIDPLFLPIIENEVKVVLSFYAPIRELGANISETTGLPIETGNALATMIDSVLLTPVRDELDEFETLWYDELSRAESAPEANLDSKERLELRPEGTSAESAEERGEKHEEVAKPLTREELLSALSAKRTMASDIEAVRQREEKENAEPPAQGYAAYAEEHKDDRV